MRPFIAAVTARVAQVFQPQFVANAYETAPASASEDFSVFGRRWNVPYVFWIVGGTDPEIDEQAKAAKQLNAIPSNRSPEYAPVLAPPVKTGLQAMLAAAAAWSYGSELAA